MPRAGSAASVLFSILVLLSVAVRAETPDYFVLRVQDKATSEPVGCATLTTTGRVIYTSDENGLVAFFEPGLMRQSVFFTVERDGYSFPADFFGFAGKAFVTSPGEMAILEMTREGDPGTCNAGFDETLLASGTVPRAAERFRIEIIDSVTHRPVPLVGVRSPKSQFVSDGNGLVAFYDPQGMGQDIFFTVASHGYDLLDPDGDGGVWLRTTPGGRATVAVRPKPDQNAHRLYRVTGGGIYRDSMLLGADVPLARPVINGLVIGQDTVFSTIYQGQPFFIWGDTNKPSYPLGSFKVSGATAVLPQDGGLDPIRGVDLQYFLATDGFAKELAPEETVPNPPGVDTFLATWLGGLTTSPGPGGGERLYANYGMFLGLSSIETGVVRWNDDDEVFEKVLVIPEDNPLLPHGPAQIVRHSDGQYIYYHNTVRLPRTEAALLNLSRYEAFTPFVEGGPGILDRAPDGTLLYAWRRDTAMITQEMINQGLDVAADEALFGHFVEPDSGVRPIVHENGSTFWNEYRGRWVRTILENFGQPSFLGEIWFAEADTPLGPWVYTRKIVTHDQYSFYNPMHHPFFDQRDGRDIFFEATYTTFLTPSEPTPRYDYNQMMYRLDLTEVGLTLPVPVYELSAVGRPGELTTKQGLRPSMSTPRAPFMAWDRPVPGSVAVYWSGASCNAPRLLAGGEPLTPPLFFALPGEADAPDGLTLPLFEFEDRRSGRPYYATEGRAPGATDRRAVQPLARVWANPLHVDLPVIEYLADLVADAGTDLCVVEDEPGEGATLTLDGSGSTHATGSIVAYSWFDRRDRRLLASGEQAQVTLPEGLTSIVLEVEGSDGKTSLDYAVVEVAPAG